jgi:GT2 family glycosyltransferase
VWARRLRGRNLRWRCHRQAGHPFIPETIAHLTGSELPHASPLPGQTRAAIILVHYGDPSTTCRCLESLARHEDFPHRVIVVDHGPGEGLPLALKGVHPNLCILSNHSNPGFGAGCNLGAEEAFRAGAEGVWFLNNDAVIEAPMLAELLALASGFPEVGMWSHTQSERGRSIGADQQPLWYAVPSHPLPPPPPGCRYLSTQESLSGASMFITRQQWEQLGPWPADFFLYWEDAAYCLRAHRRGTPLALLERAFLHDRGTTTGRRSPLTVFYGVRNHLLLHREIHPRKSATRWFMGLNLLQKRFFQGRWHLLRPTLDGIIAAARDRRGRDSRY